jgi:hypothetical protein
MLDYFEDSNISSLEFIRLPSLLQWPGRAGIYVPKVTWRRQRTLAAFPKPMKQQGIPCLAASDVRLSFPPGISRSLIIGNRGSVTSGLLPVSRATRFPKAGLHHW